MIARSSMIISRVCFLNDDDVDFDVYLIKININTWVTF
jgi:hypothetical protein